MVFGDYPTVHFWIYKFQFQLFCKFGLAKKKFLPFSLHEYYDIIHGNLAADTHSTLLTLSVK